MHRIYDSAIRRMVTSKKSTVHLSKEELLNLIVKAKSGSIEARNKIILAFTGLSLKIATAKSTMYGNDKDDLFSESLFGIIRAIELFDEDKGDPVAYIKTWIRGIITNETTFYIKKYMVSFEEIQEHLESSLTYDASGDKDEIGESLKTVLDEYMDEKEVDFVTGLCGFYPYIKPVTLDDLAEKYSMKYTTALKFKKRVFDRITEISSLKFRVGLNGINIKEIK